MKKFLLGLVIGLAINSLVYASSGNPDGVETLQPKVTRKTIEDAYVLVAETDSKTRAILMQALDAGKCKRMKFVNDAEEVLSAFNTKGSTPNIMFITRQLKGDAVETIKKLRETHSKDALIVIGLTSSLSGLDLLSFKQAGLNGYCFAPYLKEHLLTEADRCFVKQAQQAALQD